MVPFKVSGLEFSFKRVEFSLHTTRTSYVAADIIPSKYISMMQCECRSVCFHFRKQSPNNLHKKHSYLMFSTEYKVNNCLSSGQYHWWRVCIRLRQEKYCFCIIESSILIDKLWTNTIWTNRTSKTHFVKKKFSFVAYIKIILTMNWKKDKI